MIIYDKVFLYRLEFYLIFIFCFNYSYFLFKCFDSFVDFGMSINNDYLVRFVFRGGYGNIDVKFVYYLMDIGFFGVDYKVVVIKWNGYYFCDWDKFLEVNN